MLSNGQSQSLKQNNAQNIYVNSQYCEIIYLR